MVNEGARALTDLEVRVEPSYLMNILHHNRFGNHL